MSLYIRVMTGFFSHRKTIRLKTILGDDAYWIPPRLWAYAADNQPDGLFADYSPEELAQAIGYLKDARSMLEALLKAGFLDSDPLRIHDWEEHNSYHQTYADRARKAAQARWSKQDKKGKDKKGKETSIASSNASSIKGEPKGQIQGLAQDEPSKAFDFQSLRQEIFKPHILSDQPEAKP